MGESGHLFRRDGNGKVVGKLEDGWLVKRKLDPAKHRMRNGMAWCTDKAHIDWLRYNNGKGVRLYLTDGRVLEATVSDFTKWAFPIHHEGDQLALPENRLASTCKAVGEQQRGKVCPRMAGRWIC